MRFYSKKGWLTGILLWGTILFLISLLLFLPGGPEGKGEIIAASIINIISILVILWLWFGTYYDIKENQLIVVGGPFRWKIDIMTITSIKRSRNPLSSPALSLNRLEILHGKWGVIFISPKNEQKFCEYLIEINHKIDVKL